MIYLSFEQFAKVISDSAIEINYRGLTLGREGRNVYRKELRNEKYVLEILEIGDPQEVEILRVRNCSRTEVKVDFCKA